MTHAPGTVRSRGRTEFDDGARLLKALGHPLRLRLVCGLCREPSTLTRIAAELGAPLSTVALHLGVLRRGGFLTEERRAAEILFHVDDERVRGILHALCGRGSDPAPATWAWGRLARDLTARR